MKLLLLIFNVVQCDKFISGIFAGKRSQGEAILRELLFPQANDTVLYPIESRYPTTCYRMRLQNDPYIDVGVMNYPEKHQWQAYSTNIKPDFWENLKEPALMNNLIPIEDRNFDVVFEMWTTPPDQKARSNKWQLFQPSKEDEWIFILNTETREPHPVHSHGTLKRYQQWIPVTDYLRVRQDDLQNILEGFRLTGTELMSQFVDLRKLKVVFPEDSHLQKELLVVHRRIQELRWHISEELYMRFSFDVKMLKSLWRQIKALHAKQIQHCMVTMDSVWIRDWRITTPFNLSALPELVKAAKSRTLMVINEPGIIFTAFPAHQTPQKSPRMSFLLSKEPERFLAINALPMSYITSSPRVSLEGYSTLVSGVEPEKCLYPHLLLPDNLAFFELADHVLGTQLAILEVTLFTPQDSRQASLLDLLSAEDLSPFDGLRKWTTLMQENLRNILSPLKYPSLGALKRLSIHAETLAEQHPLSAIENIVGDDHMLKFNPTYLYAKEDHFWLRVKLTDDAAYQSAWTNMETTYDPKKAQAEVSHALKLIEDLVELGLLRITEIEKQRFDLRNSD